MQQYFLYVTILNLLLGVVWYLLFRRHQWWTNKTLILLWVLAYGISMTIPFLLQVRNFWVMLLGLLIMGGALLVHYFDRIRSEGAQQQALGEERTPPAEVLAASTEVLAAPAEAAVTDTPAATGEMDGEAWASDGAAADAPSLLEVPVAGEIPEAEEKPVRKEAIPEEAFEEALPVELPEILPEPGPVDELVLADQEFSRRHLEQEMADDGVGGEILPELPGNAGVLEEPADDEAAGEERAALPEAAALPEVETLPEAAASRGDEPEPEAVIPAYDRKTALELAFQQKIAGNYREAIEMFTYVLRLRIRAEEEFFLTLEVCTLHSKLGDYAGAFQVLENFVKEKGHLIPPGERLDVRKQMLVFKALDQHFREMGETPAPISQVPQSIMESVEEKIKPEIIEV